MGQDVLPLSERLVTEFDAAEILCVHVATLRNWRCLHQGPPYVKIGRLVRYRLGDLKAFISAGAHDTAGVQS